ncbi:Hypothetical predicted protein, partial [Paramuricea clavata]
DYVKAKLKSLRNSYTKAKKPQSSGSARKSLSKRAAWIRDKLQFLEPYIATRTSTSSIDVTVSHTTTPDSAESTDQLNSLNESIDDVDSITDDLLANDDDPDSETSPALPTKQPLTGKLSRRKQAEQEFEPIKGLATSIAERQNKRHKTADTHDEPMSSFGRYVTESLAELEPRMTHLSKHHINNVLFQAQMGTLSYQEGNNTAFSSDPDPQHNWFPPNPPMMNFPSYARVQQSFPSTSSTLYATLVKATGLS